MEVRTGQALEKWYREAELSLLGQEVQRIDWHGGEFASREGDIGIQRHWRVVMTKAEMTRRCVGVMIRWQV